MSEMALTADHLVVIGRGRLVADAPITEFVQQSSGGDVLVRSPAGGELARVLTRRGATVTLHDGGALAVTGLDATAIGDLAAAHRIPVHELTPRRASLEQAFMELTRDSVDYNTGAAAHTGEVR